MTALSADKDVQEKASPKAMRHERLAAASTTFYKGGMVCIDVNATGSPLVKAAAGDLTLRVVGISEEGKTTPSSPAKNLKFRSGIFPFVSGGTFEAIDADDVGKICYVLDDQTVGISGATGANAVAGRIYEYESATKVWVEINWPSAAPVGATAGG